ncbi:MAG TPA: hypothetical protein VNE21_05645 [Mycobacteriales bacterium]|nr:hypothetical protein [Mycobacteriales bacterium]
MSYASTCPAAIAALIAAFGRSADLAGVLVTDGLPVGDQTAADEAVIVGYTEADSEAAADGTIAAEGEAGNRDREKYAIHCAAGVRNSDPEQGAAARTRAFALFGGCGQAIAADRSLGSTVLTAALGAWSLSAEHPADVGGIYVRIRFDVDIDAFTNA